jgi:hypothetical protein
VTFDRGDFKRRRRSTDCGRRLRPRLQLPYAAQSKKASCDVARENKQPPESCVRS